VINAFGALAMHRDLSSDSLFELVAVVYAKIGIERPDEAEASFDVSL
jgi:hypothetical protein